MPNPHSMPLTAVASRQEFGQAHGVAKRDAPKREKFLRDRTQAPGQMRVDGPQSSSVHSHVAVDHSQVPQ